MRGVPECAESPVVDEETDHAGPLDERRCGELSYLEKDENIAIAFHVIYNR
jgi:hypothetical protein